MGAARPRRTGLWLPPHSGAGGARATVLVSLQKVHRFPDIKRSLVGHFCSVAFCAEVGRVPPVLQGTDKGCRGFRGTGAGPGGRALMLRSACLASPQPALHPGSPRRGGDRCPSRVLPAGDSS